MHRLSSLILIIAFFALTGCNAMRTTSTIDKVLVEKRIRVGITTDYPPLAFLDENMNPAGLDVDIAQRIADQMGAKLEIKTMPFKDLLPTLRAGEIDLALSGITITSDRNMFAAFAGPYFISGKSVIAKKQIAANLDAFRENGFKGIRIGVVRGTTSEAFAIVKAKNADIVYADTFTELIQLLRQHRVDAIVEDMPFCTMVYNALKNDGYIAPAKPLTTEPLGIAMAANDPLLHNWMQNFLTRLKITGTLDKLILKWTTGPMLEYHLNRMLRLPKQKHTL